MNTTNGATPAPGVPDVKPLTQQFRAAGAGRRCKKNTRPEQLSFLPPPPCRPTMPSLHSKAWLALRDMLEGPITQIDWLNWGRGWRLGAAFKELDYLGWPLGSEWVIADGHTNPIKSYFLLRAGLILAAEKFGKTAA